MFSKRFRELSQAVASCSYRFQQEEIEAGAALETAHQMLFDTATRGGIVYVIGNGGSAGIASHFSNDLMKALKLPAQTLYDTNLLTCLANDIGYEHIFSYPLEKIMKPHDLLVAISSSGKSPNIVNAAQAARSIGAPVFTLSGFHPDNPLRKLGALNYWIDRSDYGLVEMAHFFLLHTLIDLWNKGLPTVTQHAKSCFSSTQ